MFWQGMLDAIPSLITDAMYEDLCKLPNEEEVWQAMDWNLQLTFKGSSGRKPLIICP